MSLEIKTGPIGSLPGDKPKIAFHASMMAIQNAGFFIMYWDLWGFTPSADVCDSTRYAEGVMAITCFFVAFLCVGMGMAGYTDDKLAFIFYWFFHLIGGSMYTGSTVIVPLALWSDDGEACADLSPVTGERARVVYYTHAGLYLVYVGGMLAITYFSFLKSILPKLPPIFVIVLAAMFFCVPQAILYVTL